MKKLFGVFASLALVFALVGCVMGQGAKGYKSAKDQIVAAVQKKDAKAKVKFNGGNFVHLEEQTVSDSLVIVTVDRNIPESWYYEIKYTVTSSEGVSTDYTAYYFFKKGASTASEDLLGYSSYKKSVEDKSVKGKLGTL